MLRMEKRSNGKSGLFGLDNRNVVNQILRFLQLIFALAVVGLYGQDLNRAREEHKYADSKWVSLVRVFCLSIPLLFSLSVPKTISVYISRTTISNSSSSLKKGIRHHHRLPVRHHRDGVHGAIGPDLLQSRLTPVPVGLHPHHPLGRGDRYLRPNVHPREPGDGRGGAAHEERSAGRLHQPGPVGAGGDLGWSGGMAKKGEESGGGVREVIHPDQERGGWRGRKMETDLNEIDFVS